MAFSKLVVSCLAQGTVSVRVEASNVHPGDASSPDQIVIEESSSVAGEQSATQSRPDARTTKSIIDLDDVKQSLESKTFFQSEQNDCLVCVIPLEPSEHDSASILLLQQKLQALQQKLDEVRF